VKLPQQELGASFDYKRKTNLGPSGCRYISRQESGVLCGLKLYRDIIGAKVILIGPIEKTVENPTKFKTITEQLNESPRSRAAKS